ncbi:MAG: DNA replication and repair protein RecF [Candidatus Gracilibacteria bacterium]|nr:DNA replication and repair protein RecF [Candidatus Gracilibacteria bacterium]
MIKKIILTNFKNHKNIEFVFDEINLIIGDNGKGKTSILEAIYFSNNLKSPFEIPVENLINNFSENTLIRLEIEKDDLFFEIKIAIQKDTRKIKIFANNKQVSKSELNKILKYKTIFFSLLEINLIYLGPNLRRNFLDEILENAFEPFNKLKNNYSKIIKNRNKILKNIFDKKSGLDELKFWDDSFLEIANEYYNYRVKIVDYIKNNINVIEDLLDNKYKLTFNYLTKVDLKDTKKSIKDYLGKNKDRDVFLGKTCIGPHLDDFNFDVNIEDNYYSSDNYLSRGENKTIIVGLKMLQISFLKELFPNNKIILLLDDLFAELDKKHIGLILDNLSNNQSFITAQFLPHFIEDMEEINILKID